MVIMDNQVNNSLSKCRIITQKSYTRCQISLLLLMNYSQLPSLGPLPLPLLIFFFLLLEIFYTLFLSSTYTLSFCPKRKNRVHSLGSNNPI